MKTTKKQQLSPGSAIGLSIALLAVWLLGLILFMPIMTSHLARLGVVVMISLALVGLARLIRRLPHSGYWMAIIASALSAPAYYLFHPLTGHGEWIFALAVIAVSARWGIGPGFLAALLSTLGYGVIAYSTFSHDSALTDTFISAGFFAMIVFIVGTIVRHREAALVARAHMADELEKTSATTLIALTRALDARDQDTEGHSERVADLAMEIGREMGLEEAVLSPLRLAALMHDIGKIGVPDVVLHKPGPLFEQEWALIRKHPQTGFDILKNIPYLAPALDAILQHHEKYNGKGYPVGLSGDAISLSARILAIVDVYDALTSNRPYRPAFSPEKALEIIRGEAGQQFDPEVVQAFVRIPAIFKANPRK
ncbi:MAG: HD domain-containing phosphohydrolase [Anaerolineales bacterium]